MSDCRHWRDGKCKGVPAYEMARLETAVFKAMRGESVKIVTPEHKTERTMNAAKVIVDHFSEYMNPPEESE